MRELELSLAVPQEASKLDGAGNVDEAAVALALPRAEVVQGKTVRNFHVHKSDSTNHGATLGCKACSFVS